MKLAVFASLLSAAAAFAPAKEATRASSLAASFDSELGAQAPLNFYDPLGLVEGKDASYFNRLRYVEIKHGRVAMIAVAGYLTAEAGFRFPGDIALDGTTFADIPNGFAAFGALPTAGLVQIIAFIGYLECGVMKDITGGEFPGDLRNNYIDFGWDTFDAATKLQKRAVELNNGRAAMMGILGLMVHEQLGVPVLPGV
jgi:hypothetical protein